MKFVTAKVLLNIDNTKDWVGCGTIRTHVNCYKNVNGIIWITVW